MAPSLILGADAAYPFDYSILPAGVAVILGYVAESQTTPHLWTAAEIAAAEATGRQWWAIVTAPERALTAVDGTRAAAAMFAALLERGYSTSRPVFYDIEHSAYAASPTGAMAARAAWLRGMVAAGWRRAYAYLPAAAGVDWLAHWGIGRPTSLPARVIGIQYDHGLDGDRYDLSVFDPRLLEATVTAPSVDQIVSGVKTMLLKGGVLADLNTQTDQLQAWLNPRLGSLGTQLAAVAMKVDALSTGAGVDVPALAAALAADLGPDLGHELIVALRDALPPA